MLIKQQREYTVLQGLDGISEGFRNLYRVGRTELDAKRKSDPETLKRLRNRVERTTPVTETPKFTDTSFRGPMKAKGFHIFTKPSREEMITKRETHLGSIRLGGSAKNSASMLAHEYGHALDYASKGGLDRFADRHVADSGSSVILNGEVTASKNGLKVLKKVGASHKEMVNARRSLKNALGTYYHAAAANNALENAKESSKDYLKRRLTEGRRLRNQYKDYLKELDTLGRTGAERAYEASQRSKVKNVGRAIKKTFLENETARHAVEKASQAGDKTKKKIIKKVFKHLIK